jgi:hypothetical protein
MSDSFARIDAGAGERPLFLKELIAKVHTDLLDSQREREERGDPPIFQVAELTLEVHFIVQESGEASGGLDLKVLTVGGKRQFENQQVHKVTLRLVGVPQGHDGGFAFTDDSLPTFRPSEH